MTVYRLRKKQRGPKCSYCDEKAAHRGCHFTKFACSYHLAQLTEDDRRQTASDEYHTEAEFQLGL